MLDFDWQALFIPSNSLTEIVVRGTVIYLALFLAMRFLPRRTVGGMGPSDLLLIVLIADAVQNGMGGRYESITEALVLAAVLFAWDALIDWLDFRFPQLAIAAGRPVIVIRDGMIIHRNLARERMSEEELMSQLRQHGIDSPRSVRSAFIEGDGHMSVLLRGGVPLVRPNEHRGH